MQAGLPLVAFSAGTVFCGQDIRTTSDSNDGELTHFGGLALTRFNFHVHYPALDGPERRDRDGRLQEYHAFNPHPVLALEDGAHLRVIGDSTVVKSGSESTSGRSSKSASQPGVHAVGPALAALRFDVGTAGHRDAAGDTVDSIIVYPIQSRSSTCLPE